MEAQEWYEEFHVKRIQEATQRAATEAAKKAMERGLEQGLEQGRFQLTTRLFEMRLTRPLTDAERKTIGERLRALGPERLGEVVLAFTADATAAWLGAPDAR